MGHGHGCGVCGVCGMSVCVHSCVRVFTVVCGEQPCLGVCVVVHAWVCGARVRVCCAWCVWPECVHALACATVSRCRV